LAFGQATEAEHTAEAAADHRALVAALAADPDWTKLVEGRDIFDFMPWDRA